MNNTTTTNTTARHIYAAGAACKDSTKAALSFVVCEANGVSKTVLRNVSLSGNNEHTDNRYTVQALLRALRAAKGEDTIYVNLSYISASYNEYIEQWKDTGWKKARGKKVAHSDLWMQIWELKQAKPSVTVGHMKGNDKRMVRAKDAAKERAEAL